MAGESPDRSKRYESSTGSTQAERGEGGTVPKPADPRLAVAQEKVSVPGASAPAAVGVDQATAVFSRRALEEAERALDSSGGSDSAGTDSSSGSGSEAGSAAGPKGAEGSGDSGNSGRDSGPEGEDDAGTEPEAEAEGEPRPKPDSESEPKSETTHESASTSKSASASASAGVTESGDDGTPDMSDKSGTADSEASDKPDAAPEPAPQPDAPATDAGDTDADADDAADKTSSTEAGTDSEARPPSKPDSGPESDGGTDEAAPKPPVDQPTAVFKAVRPPAADQPTTMLKLGGATKPKDAADQKDPKEASTGSTDKPVSKPASRPASRPEPEAGRTSKFVALKPLDEPRPPRTAPAEATAALPQLGPERTAQQPLPPKPPLDLLAELTNTPPPPPTPVRTFVRRVKIWTPLVVLLLIIFAVVQAVRPLPAPTLALTADKTHAFEGGKLSLPWPNEGQGAMDVTGIGTMDSFGEQKAVPIGSVAKAMTAYVVLRDHPLKAGSKGPSVPVDALAEKEGGYDADGESTLNTVKEGDALSLQDAVAAIMIPSANNIARLLARWDANGSEEEFVKKMNAAAKDLGMTNTTYTDPSGLKETTVSTAEDQVKLGNELVKMKALTDITRLPSWKDPSGKEWRNYNTLVPYDNAIGIKTGSTTKAGGNLLFAATKEVGGETVTIVGAILGQHTPPIIDTVNAVSKTALLAAQSALTSDKILKKGDVVGYVDDGLGGHTPVVATKDVSAVGWAGQTVKLALSDDGRTIPNEAKAGTKVGALTVGDGKGDAVEVPVALQSDLTEPGFGSKLTRVG